MTGVKDAYDEGEFTPPTPKPKRKPRKRKAELLERVKVVNCHMGGRKFWDLEGNPVLIGQTAMVPKDMANELARKGLAREVE